MAPKVIPLAYAGKKLTGPPEGYGRKQELQVKRWLTSAGGLPEPEASVASASEVRETRGCRIRSICTSSPCYGQRAAEGLVGAHVHLAWTADLMCLLRVPGGCPA